MSPRELESVAACVGLENLIDPKARDADVLKYLAYDRDKLEKLAALGLSTRFHQQLAKKAIRSLKNEYPGDYRLTILVCDFDGQFIVRVSEGEHA